MTVLGRITMMFVGYVMGCVAAAIVLTLGSLGPEWSDVTAQFGPQPPGVESAALWSVAAMASIVIFVVGFLPVLLAIALAEGLALRSAVIYGVIGAALALAMAYGLDFAGYITGPNDDAGHNTEVFAAAGIAGGLVYWLFAGRKAGAWK
ncbi:MAG: hypothetical protein WAK55_11820 [Xanthobacteraceae bacterium]